MERGGGTYSVKKIISTIKTMTRYYILKPERKRKGGGKRKGGMMRIRELITTISKPFQPKTGMKTEGRIQDGASERRGEQYGRKPTHSSKKRNDMTTSQRKSEQKRHDKQRRRISARSFVEPPGCRRTLSSPRTQSAYQTLLIRLSIFLLH